MAITSPDVQAAAQSMLAGGVEGKLRVHAVAKELGVTSREVADHLAEIGIPGKRQLSNLGTEEIRQLLESLVGSVSSGDDAVSGAVEDEGDDTAAADEVAPEAVDEPELEESEEAEVAEDESEAGFESEPEGSDDGEEADFDDDIEDTDDAAETSADSWDTIDEIFSNSPKNNSRSYFDDDNDFFASLQEDLFEPENSTSSLLDSLADNLLRSDAEPVEPAQPAVDIAAADTSDESDDAADADVADTADVNAETADITEVAPRRRRVRRVIRRVPAAPEPEEDPAPTEDRTATDAGAEDVAPEFQPPAEEEVAEAPKPAPRPKPTRGRRPQRATTERAASKEETSRQSDHPIDKPKPLRGSVRLASQRRWRQEKLDNNTRAVTRSEFLAHRDGVDRRMVVRDRQRDDAAGLVTQLGIVEDGHLVEHIVSSENQETLVGNIYLGRVENVLASMEAAFIDIGVGRNAVLYAGEMNWHSPHLHAKNRRIEQAVRPGDLMLVQVLKDPLGQKGARLTGRISFAGRYLVYFPGGTTAGISRKLPEGERRRLKDILGRVLPDEGGAIIRTAAESTPEEDIARDVDRLHAKWEALCTREAELRERAAEAGTGERRDGRDGRDAKENSGVPALLHEEPDAIVRTIRDLFNEDFNELIVDGEHSWSVVTNYITSMAPDLSARVHRWDRSEHDGRDAFTVLDLEEQLQRGFSRKVYLPSGGYLIFDRTEAMHVIDVNTGSFVGAGGNLEETVTLNNLEAAEEIVRQLRLRDLGGMIVVDFIDMVLEENRDLVLRRLGELLATDHTRNNLSEVTSLGLVQITRKRVDSGLIEMYSTTCTECDGRGIILHDCPVEQDFTEPVPVRRDHGARKERQQARDLGKKTLAELAKTDAHWAEIEATEAAAAAAAAADATHETVVGSGERFTAPGEPGSRRMRRVIRRRMVRDVEAPEVDAEGADATEVAEGAEAGVAESREPSQSEQSGRSRRTRRRRSRGRAAQSRAEGQDATEQEQEGPSLEERRAAYLAAVEAFDSSPRRRRNTRGNSRSDVRPTPADFDLSEADVASDTEAAAPAREADSTEGQQSGRSSSARRRLRRRVVRSRNEAGIL